MPGDPNVYALGVEFKLSATQAIQTLENIEHKLANIDRVVAEAFKLNVNAGDAVKSTERVEQNLKNISEKLSVDIKGGVRTVQELNDHYKDQVLSVTELHKAHKLMRDAYVDLNKKMDIYEEELKNQPELLIEAQKQLTKLEDTYGKLSQKSSAAAADEKIFMSGLQFITGISPGTAKSILTIADAFGLVPESLKKTLPSIFDYNTTMKGMGAGSDAGINKTVESINNATKAMDSGSNVSGAFGDSASEAAAKAADSHGQLSDAVKATSDITKAFGDGAKAVDGTVGGMTKALDASATATNALGSEAAVAAEGMGGAMSGAAGASAELAGGLGAAGAGAGAAAAGAAAAVPHVAVLMAVMELANKAAAAFAGALDALGASGSDSGKALMDAIKSGSLFGAVWAFVKTAILAVIETQEAFRTTTYRAYGSINDCTNAAIELQEELALTREEAVGVTKAMIHAGTTLVANKKQFAELSKSVAQFSVATGVSEETAAGFTRVMMAQTGSDKEATAALATFIPAMERLGVTVQKLTAIIDDLTKRAPSLKAMWGKKAVVDYTNAIIALGEAFTEQGGNIDDAGAVMEKLADPGSKLRLMTLGVRKEFGELGKAAPASLDILQARYGKVWQFMNPLVKQRIAQQHELTVGQMDMAMAMKMTTEKFEEYMKKNKQAAEDQEKQRKLNEEYQKSLNTIRQQMMRLLQPLMAILEKAMPPFIDFLLEVVEIAKPVVKAISWVIDLLNKIGAIKATLVGFGALILAIGAVIAAAMAPAIAFFTALMAAVIGTGYILWGLWEVIKAVFGFIIDLAKDVWDSLTGSGLFGLDLLIAAIKAPFEFLIGLFQKLWDWVKKVADIASKPFTAIKEGVKGAVGGVLGIVEKIPIIGKAASWVKGKLFGSGLFGIDDGAVDAVKSLTKMQSPLAGIGKTAETQMPRVTKLFDAVSKVGATEISPVVKNAMAHAYGIEPGQMDAIEHVITGAMGAPTTQVKPVASAIEQEMGRETGSEKELREMKEKLASLIRPLTTIEEVLGNDINVKAIIRILEKYLPKMTERPSELGPAISAW